MDITGGKLEAAETRRDLLQHVIEQGKRPDNDQPLTSLEIIDHMSEVLIGGSETTSTQIGTLFLELARNPIVRSKLLAALPIVSIHDENVVSAKSVRLEKEQYEYLEACIKENLRLHPIASELGRRTGADWMDLGGYSLPPYTVVCASYRAVHRSETYWPQPLRFWPERVSRTHTASSEHVFPSIEHIRHVGPCFIFDYLLTTASKVATRRQERRCASSKVRSPADLQIYKMLTSTSVWTPISHFLLEDILALGRSK